MTPPLKAVSAQLLGLYAVPLTSCVDVARAACDQALGVKERDGVPTPDVFRPFAGVRFYNNVAMNRYLTASSMVLGALTLPDRETTERIRAEVASTAQSFANRGWVANPERFHQRLDAPTDVQEKILKRVGDSELVRLTFTSGYKPSDALPESARVRYQNYIDEGGQGQVEGFLWRKANAAGTSRPTIVSFHGLGLGTKSDMSGFDVMNGRHLHESTGHNVLEIQFPFHGSRKLGRRSLAVPLGSDVLDSLQVQAQGMSDSRQAMRWVEQTYPGGTMSAYGISQGGMNAAVAASLEPGLKQVVSIVPVVDPVNTSLVPFASHWGEEMMKAAPFVLAPITALTLKPAVPVDRLHVIGAVADRLLPPVDSANLAKHWGVKATFNQGEHIWSARNSHLQLSEIMSAT